MPVWAAGAYVFLLVAALALIVRFGKHDHPPHNAPADVRPVSAGVYLPDGAFIPETLLQEKVPLKDRGYARFLHVRGRLATVMAPATDFQQHVVNAFLTGYVPDGSVSPWIPLNTLVQRKRYQLDLDQYGQEEVWQTSYQAYMNERGDCEDHALALADWLIGLGLDARVVLGRHKGIGHAWVVVMEGNRSFLLEATEKRRRFRWSYPLTQLFPDYLPRVMFNRHLLWEMLPSRQPDYLGERWRWRSMYYGGETR